MRKPGLALRFTLGIAFCLYGSTALAMPQGDPQPAPAAPAGDPAIEAQNKATALKAFENGTGHFERAEYDQAIAEFETGYRAVPQAVFLFNIAQSHRMAGRTEQALSYYRKYIKQDPGARNFNEVRGRIEQLEQKLQEDARAKAQAQADEEAKRKAQLASEPPPAPLSPDPLTVTRPPPPKAKRPVWPIVLGVVGGAVLVGAGVGLGVYFGTQTSGPPQWQPVTP